MKKSINVGIAVVLMSSTSLAFAALPGAYVGGGVGLTQSQTPNNILNLNSNGNVVSSKSSIAGVGGRLFAGYNFNQYVGLEMGLAKYGRYSSYTLSKSNVLVGVPISYSQSAIDLVGKAYLPIMDSGFNVYALGGAAYTKSTSRSSSMSITTTGNSITLLPSSKTVKSLRPVYGLGASYDFPQTNFSTNLEWSRIQGKGNLKHSANAIPTTDTVMLNVSYKLPL